MTLWTKRPLTTRSVGDPSSGPRPSCPPVEFGLPDESLPGTPLTSRFPGELLPAVGPQLMAPQWPVLPWTQRLPRPALLTEGTRLEPFGEPSSSCELAA